MQKTLTLLGVFVLSFLAAVTPALSAVDPQCIEELEKQCGEIKPGGGRVAKCFTEKKDKFSAKCQLHLSEEKANAADALLKAKQQKAQGKTDAKP